MPDGFRKKSISLKVTARDLRAYRISQHKADKLRGFSPRANYTDKLVPTFADRGMSRSQHGGSPTAVISVF
jgi:hypothetical protein